MTHSPSHRLVPVEATEAINTALAKLARYLKATDPITGDGGKIMEPKAAWITARDGLREAMNFLVDLRDALAAAPQPPAPVTWRGIESAPRDGTEILLGRWMLYIPGQREWQICRAWWGSENGCWMMVGGKWEPTHWMPLPEPPL